MLEGFRSRDAGVVSVLGMDPSDRACQRTLPERLGVVVQDLAVEPFLSVEEVLSRSASYYLNPCDVGEVIRSVGLEEKATTRVKSLSGGQQLRLDLGLGVTSLTAEAVNFFSRSLVGCEKGRSSPEDVAGGVFVGVGVVPTADAFERRLGDAVLPGCVVAGFAAVGAVPGVHADDLPPSFFRFGCKDRAELCPARVGDACVQPGLGRRSVGQEGSGDIRVGEGPGTADHVGDLQALDDDDVVVGHECLGGLVVEVSPAVGHLAMPGGHRLPGRPAVIRAPLLSSEGLLGHLQLARRLGAPAGVVDVVALGGDSEAGDAHVDAYHRSGRLYEPERHVIPGEHEHPAPALPVDLHGLDPSLDLAVRAHLHIADTLEVDTARLGLETAPVAIRGPYHAVKAVRRLKAWVAGCLARLHPAEERLESPVETAKRNL